ncbi:transposon Ty3-I Gag-Pol polyprotein [Trichonephila clavipes]|nr:transposon Ty3-I Gag-Pol polyprotein [Trichonephila clavipes]
MLKIVKSKKNLKSVNSRLHARKNNIYRRHNENDSKRRIISLSTPSSTSFHRKTRSKQTDRRMTQRRHYTSEFIGICKSNRNGHIVESGTIKLSPTKTLAVRKFPEPTTTKQVHSFLGLTGYFRSISEDYSKKELITRIARWVLQLEEFDYEIEHRAESRMKHVDALSRYPVMIVCNDTLTSKLKKAQEEDDNIQTLKSLLEKQESKEFFERNGILYKYLNGRELIVTPKAMEAELIKLIHEIASKKTGKKEGFLNPISKGSIPLSTYDFDFIGPLPSTNKSYQHIFTVVDAFTKFTWLYPVKTVSAESAPEKLKQQ